MIIADENINSSLVEKLRSKNYEVIYIREHSPGMKDRDIVTLVRNKTGILITEDKDFGELVFAHNFKNISVIFLRHEKEDYPVVERQLLQVLESYYAKGGHFYITITRTKIRITEI